MIQATHGACTHVGQVRRDNEDAYVAVEGLYMVADGMGGHSAGEVASALTVATLKDAYLMNTDPAARSGLRTPDDVAEAIALANTAVFVEALDDSSKSGMGTTLTGIVVTDAPNNQIVVANVGDSRTYLWRNNELRQITKDHSHVQTLVDRGAITPAEARVHYQRNIVLRAIGIDAEVHVDLFPLTVEDGDRFIMCSDGLVDEADDDEIINEIRLQEQPQDLAERLVQLANDNGGRDNITVIVVDFAAQETTPAPTIDNPTSMSSPPARPETSSVTTAETLTPAPNERSISGFRRVGRAVRIWVRTRVRARVGTAMRRQRTSIVAISGAIVAVFAVIIAVISSL